MSSRCRRREAGSGRGEARHPARPRGRVGGKGATRVGRAHGTSHASVTAPPPTRAARVRGDILAPLLALLLLTACDREDRRFREAPPAGAPSGVVRMSELQPGPAVMASNAANPYDENAYALSQGQRLFAWYNCSGCHANGGGGMGPPLMDDEWIYGSQPGQIYKTIMEGRPNGMPSFAGRIPGSQVWQIVAYVRAMGGLVPASVRNARADHMMTLPEAQTLMSPEDTKQGGYVPPASVQP